MKYGSSDQTQVRQWKTRPTLYNEEIRRFGRMQLNTALKAGWRENPTESMGGKEGMGVPGGTKTARQSGRESGCRWKEASRDKYFGLRPVVRPGTGWRHAISTHFRAAGRPGKPPPVSTDRTSAPRKEARRWEKFHSFWGNS